MARPGVQMLVETASLCGTQVLMLLRFLHHKLAGEAPSNMKPPNSPLRKAFEQG